MLRDIRRSGNSTFSGVERDAQAVRFVQTAEPAVSWQTAMKQAVRDPRELCRLLDLPDQFIAPAIAAAKSFPLFVPRSYLARMQPGDPHDPLLRQVLPLGDELLSVEGFTSDPVGDLPASRSPGFLQKYHGRALLVTTGACAVHCRYCFRRHFPYTQTPRSVSEWSGAIDQIAADTSLREVILSGGDPLTLVDPLLSALTARLAEIPHLKILRVHTRLPLMIPERIDRALLDWLCGSRLTPIVVIHANHPAELQGAAADAISRLVDAGVPVLNQTVLLRGVNDDLETLVILSERLTELRAMPYYLHQLDHVAGAAHFEVSPARGLQLIAGMRQRLPGYAVPRYVVEQAGQSHKTPLEFLT